VIASLPIHKYVWVDSSHIRTNGTGWEQAVWFGLVSQYGRTWGLNVLLECGAIYRSLPPHAIAFCKEPEPWTVTDAQLWDCYADKFQLHEYGYLKEMTVRTKNPQRHISLHRRVHRRWLHPRTRAAKRVQFY
jgi:hypothetical protein